MPRLKNAGNCPLTHLVLLTQRGQVMLFVVVFWQVFSKVKIRSEQLLVEMFRLLSAWRAVVPSTRQKFYPVWLRLADLASDEDRLAVLRRAVDAGAESITVLLRLAGIELETDPDAALETCRSAAELEPVAAEGALCLGRAYLALDEPLRAAPHLRRAAVLGRGTVVGESAAELLRDEAPR